MKTPDERHAQDSVLSEFNLAASMHFNEISALTLRLLNSRPKTSTRFSSVGSRIGAFDLLDLRFEPVPRAPGLRSG
jgi:hypothetical protein